MKAIMYHYVRPDTENLPYFKHLHVDDFRKQLDFFDRTFGFVSKEDFIRSFETGIVPGGVVLTFDDGLVDHYQYVLPELQRRNLWAIFYIAGAHDTPKDLLDVHQIQVLIGMFGGARIYEVLTRLVHDDMLIYKHRQDFKTRTYRFHKEGEATKEVKRTLNYYIAGNYRREVLDALSTHFGLDTHAIARELYLSDLHIRELHQCGMIIGAHTVHHPVMSTLTYDEQRREIQDSFTFLEKVVGTLPIRTFCYPYGGAHSFNDDTEKIVHDSGCLFSFDVDPRDISSSDVRKHPQTLPRYDCNHFPYGAVRQHTA